MIPYIWKAIQQIMILVIGMGQYGIVMDQELGIYEEHMSDGMNQGYNTLLYFVYNKWFAAIPFIGVCQIQFYLLIQGNYVRFK